MSQIPILPGSGNIQMDPLTGTSLDPVDPPQQSISDASSSYESQLKEEQRREERQKQIDAEQLSNILNAKKDSVFSKINDIDTQIDETNKQYADYKQQLQNKPENQLPEGSDQATQSAQQEFWINGNGRFWLKYNGEVSSLSAQMKADKEAIKNTNNPDDIDKLYSNYEQAGQRLKQLSAVSPFDISKVSQLGVKSSIYNEGGRTGDSGGGSARINNDYNAGTTTNPLLSPNQINESFMMKSTGMVPYFSSPLEAKSAGYGNINGRLGLLPVNTDKDTQYRQTTLNNAIDQYQINPNSDNLQKIISSKLALEKNVNISDIPVLTQVAMTQLNKGFNLDMSISTAEQILEGENNRLAIYGLKKIENMNDLVNAAPHRSWIENQKSLQTEKTTVTVPETSGYLSGPMGLSVVSIGKIGNNPDAGMKKEPEPAQFGPNDTLGLLTASMAAGKVINDAFSDIQNQIPSGFLGSPVKAGLGYLEGIATIPVFVGEVGGAAWMLGNQPKKTSSIAPSVISDFVTGTIDFAVKNPERFVGNIIGASDSPRLFKVAGEFSPLKSETASIPTGKTIVPSATDVWLQNKLQNSPIIQGAIDQFGLVNEFEPNNNYIYLKWGGFETKSPKILGGIAYGSEFSPKIFMGEKNLHEIMAKTNIDIQTPYAKYAPFEWTQGQKDIATPFLSKTAESPFVQSVVNLPQDLARTRNIKLEPYQPQGTALQKGVDFETSIGIQKALGKGGEKTITVGSRFAVDFLGEDYMRNVFESDIDVSAGKTQQYQMWKDLKTAFKDTDILPRRNDMNNAATPPEKRGISFGAPGEEHTIGVHPLEYNTDVKGYPTINIAGGKTWIQTPENFILTKSSRVFGTGSKAEIPATFKYSPDTGITTTKLTGGKQVSDLADIYAMSRGIAENAYKQKLYDLGKVFEKRSDAIANELKTNNKLNSPVEKIIKKDKLEGVPRAPVRIGNVLGINLGGVKISKAAKEYPVSKSKVYEIPEKTYPIYTNYQISKTSVKNIVSNSSYPSSSGKTYTISKEAYPIKTDYNKINESSYPTSKINSENYPSKISSDNYPSSNPYPTIPTKDYYPTNYPTKPIKNDYPTNIPYKGEYPTGGTASKTNQYGGGSNKNNNTGKTTTKIPITEFIIKKKKEEENFWPRRNADLVKRVTREAPILTPFQVLTGKNLPVQTGKYEEYDYKTPKVSKYITKKGKTSKFSNRLQPEFLLNKSMGKNNINIPNTNRYSQVVKQLNVSLPHSKAYSGKLKTFTIKKKRK